MVRARGNTVRVVVPHTESSSSRRGWLRSDATPDRVRMLALVTVLMIVVVGVVVWLLTDRLVTQTDEVATSTGEVLIATQQVSASFAEADAAAVSVHLAGADGNREQRRLYEQATERATASLERVARLVGADEPSHDALQAVAADTVAYAGLVETARLSSIESLADANSVLRAASDLNRNEISPAVDIVARRAANRFDEQVASGWYAVAIVLLIVVLVVLVGGQIMLSRQFRRIINVPLLVATLLVALLVAAATRGFLTQQQALDDADSEAFQAIQVSERIQQTAYRHRALATSSALDRTPTPDLADLEAEMGNATDGLLAEAIGVASSERERAGAEELVARWDRYLAESTRSQVALASGDAAAAESLIQGAANSAFNGFNTTVEAALLDNREQFLDQLDTASNSLRWLRELILVGSLLGAIFAWWGFAQRIGEYR